MWVQSSTLETISPTKMSTQRLVWICWLVIAELFALSWNLLSGGPLFREHNDRKLLKFATQKYFKNKFWQDCKIRKKKDFCINLSFPEMFLITIKKAADQGATCKDSLDIDYTVLFYVLWRIILLALLLMFVSVLVYF